jgi:hypothetical protein
VAGLRTFFCGFFQSNNNAPAIKQTRVDVGNSNNINKCQFPEAFQGYFKRVVNGMNPVAEGRNFFAATEFIENTIQAGVIDIRKTSSG